jgi:hypothetical protein
MSGPTTAIFIGDPIAVLLAASAIRAAQAVAAGYEHAENLRGEQRAHRERLRAGLKDAAAKGRAALQQEVKAVEVEFEAITRLAERYAARDTIMTTRPATPDSGNELQLAAYVNAMRALIMELRAILQTESALRMDELGEEAGLDAAIAQAAASGSATPVQRLLARIAHLGDVPQDIAGVAREIAAIPFADTERARLLTNELRMRIQKHVEAAQAHAVEEASALVLQQSLQDLGYQVEDVSNTLFVEGGVVHFRRQGWENYMVRMRVDPEARTANFNVVRAVGEAHNERSVLDHLAEDRWCAEFPALLQALALRGLHLNITRRLEAGEMPVQLVHKDKLPRFAEEEDAAPGQKLLSRKIT